MTVKKKLFGGILASMASTLILSAISLRVIGALGDSLDEAVNSTGKRLDLIGQTRTAFQDMLDGSREAQTAYAIADMAKTATGKEGCVACHEPSPVGESLSKAEAASRAVHERSGQLKALISDPAARHALETLERDAARWSESYKEYLRLAGGGNFDDAHTILQEKMFPLFEDAGKAAKILSQKESEALAAANREAHAKISGGRRAMAAVIAFNLMAGLALLFVAARVVNSLRRALAAMSEGAAQVATAASDVSSSSHALARETTSQTASLEETAASSAEINSVARGNIEHTREAARLTSASQKQFAEAHAALTELQEAMAGINASSGKIANVLKVIDEIAFQTNILALNAAVEAARAGEAGLGFAVVAGEVRNLAQRCAQATRDTSVLIEESLASSGHGKSSVERVAEAIRIVTGQSASIAKLVEEVGAGSQEQGRGVEQVSRALSQIEGVTQRTAANAEAGAAAGEELSTLAEALMARIAELGAMINGDSGGARRNGRQLKRAVWE